MRLLSDICDTLPSSGSDCCPASSMASSRHFFLSHRCLHAYILNVGRHPAIPLPRCSSGRRHSAVSCSYLAPALCSLQALHVVRRHPACALMTAFAHCPSAVAAFASMPTTFAAQTYVSSPAVGCVWAATDARQGHWPRSDVIAGTVRNRPHKVGRWKRPLQG